MSGAAEQERGWYPDFLYRNDQVESGVAMFADGNGNITRFSSQPADLALAQRLPNRAIFPGLVNAHSHAFQRAVRGRAEHRTHASHDSFWTWREAMYYAAVQLSPQDVYDISRMAFLEMLSTGITTVGEFHYLHHAPDGARYDDPNLLAQEVIRAAQDIGIRIALLRTAYVRAGWNQPPNPRQARFLTATPELFISDTQTLAQTVCRTHARDRAWVGIAPHSVRAVPLSFLQAITEFGRTQGMPVHMHVAEQPAEIEACLAEYGERPVGLLAQHGILDPRFTAVHATHTTSEEIAQLTKANICACPTTERNLGDGIAPADRWSEAKINVCLGSDSNIQIDLLEDARELEYHLRLNRLERAILPATALFGHATKAGARSLAAPGGELAEGKPADFFTLDLNHASVAGADAGTLLPILLFAGAKGAICDVYVAGRGVVIEGRQISETEVRARFQAAMKRLWSD